MNENETQVAVAERGPTDSGRKKSSDGMFFTFESDRKSYAIPVLEVVEIVALPEITPVPDMPAYVKGLINLRGRVIPVIDIRIRFQFKQEEYHDRTCVVIISAGDKLVGLIVDAVSEVLRIPEDHFQSAPQVGENTASRFITATGIVNDSVFLVLDLPSLLNDRDFAPGAFASLDQAATEVRQSNLFPPEAE